MSFRRTGVAAFSLLSGSFVASPFGAAALAQTVPPSSGLPAPRPVVTTTLHTGSSSSVLVWALIGYFVVLATFGVLGYLRWGKGVVRRLPSVALILTGSVQVIVSGNGPTRAVGLAAVATGAVMLTLLATGRLPLRRHATRA